MDSVAGALTIVKTTMFPPTGKSIIEIPKIADTNRTSAKTRIGGFCDFKTVFLRHNQHSF